MSAASTKAPRANPSASSRRTLFWPMMIFLVGAGSLTSYQVMSLEDQLDEVTRAVDKLDFNVKHAQYEKAKFYAMARDLIRMAPQNASAGHIVDDMGLRRLQKSQPVLMSLDTPSGFTNAAPIDPAVAAAATNGTSTVPPLPGTK